MKFASRPAIITALGLAALLVLSDLPTGVRAFTQEVETQVAGELDQSFGNGGKVATDFGGKTAAANALAIQRDGKIVSAGYESLDNIHYDLAIARYNPDGTLDSGFGVGGKVTTDFFNQTDSVAAIAIQPDDKIVVAGASLKSSDSNSRDFALARYNANGSLDTSFGNGGKITTDISGFNDSAYALELLPDGRLLAAGIAQSSTAEDSTNFALVRYNANGSLDASFGNGGRVITDLFGHDDQCAEILVQGNGKVLASGYSQTNSSFESRDFTLIRYKLDGSVDADFGTGGHVTTDFFGHADHGGQIAITRNGKIVVAGVCQAISTASRDFALARYNSDGTIDTAFGSAGKVSTDFFGQSDGGGSLLILPDDKMLVSGSRRAGPSSNTQDFALLRYNADGGLDTSFGSDGKVATDFFGGNDFANAMAMQSDGKVVLAGWVTSSSGMFNMGLARYSLSAIPDFVLAFEQLTVSGERGTKVPINILINRTAGFAGNVIITPPDTSAIGIKVKPPDAISTIDSSVKVKLKIKESAAAGTQMLIFTATDDLGRVRTATLTLIVQ